MTQDANMVYIVCPLDIYNIPGFLRKIEELREKFAQEGLRVFPDCYHTYQDIVDVLDPQKTSIEGAESYHRYIDSIYHYSPYDFGIIFSHPMYDVEITDHEATILNNRDRIKFIYACKGYNNDLMCVKTIQLFRNFSIPIVYEDKKQDEFYYPEFNKKLLIVTPIDSNPIGIDAPDEESWWTFDTVISELKKYKEKLDKLTKTSIIDLLEPLNFNIKNCLILKTKPNKEGFLRRVKSVVFDLYKEYEEDNISKERGAERSYFVRKNEGKTCYALYCHGWKNCRRAVYDHQKLEKAGVISLYAPGEEV